MDSQLGYGNFGSDLPLNIFSLYIGFFIQIVWSDEKKFNLDGPDGFAYYWRDLRKDPRYSSKRGFGGGSVMVWAGFSAFVTHRMSIKNYQNVLENNLLPYMRRFPSIRFTYQQDNARIHVSTDTEGWLKKKKVSTLDWPARSPDLNPMENLWGILARRLRRLPSV
jgi:hypothetical protein